MLDVYRRRGFHTITDEERHVLSELQLAAIVDVQEILADLRESLKLQPLIEERVTKLETWQEKVEDGIGDVLQDRVDWQEGSKKLRWGLAEKIAAALVFLIVAALLLYFGIRPAGALPSVEIGSRVGAVHEGAFAEGDEGEEHDEQQREQPRIHRLTQLLPTAECNRSNRPPPAPPVQVRLAVSSEHRHRRVPVHPSLGFQHVQRVHASIEVHEPRDVSHTPQPVPALAAVPQCIEPRHTRAIGFISPGRVPDLKEIESPSRMGDGGKGVGGVVDTGHTSLLKSSDTSEVPAIDHEHGIQNLQPCAVAGFAGVGHDLRPVIHHPQQVTVRRVLIPFTRTS